MKKILFLILTFFILTNFVNAQWPITQNLGSDSTLISVGRNFGGGIKGSLINKSYTDTTAANLSHADFYAGAQIFTTSDTSFWIRNKTATNTYWFKIGGAGGGATGSFWGLTGNYIAVTPANLGIGTNDPFNDLPFKTNNTVRLRLPLNGLERQSGGAWKPMLFDTTNLIWGYGDAGGTNWSLTGNSGTTAGTNFIGTTDAVDFVTKTDGTERTRVSSSGNVGIGTSSPLSLLNIKRDDIQTTQSDAYGLYLENATEATNAIRNQATPGIVFKGSAWTTGSGGSNQTHLWRQYVQPVFSASTTSSTWKFQTNQNGAGYSDVLSLLSGSTQNSNLRILNYPSGNLGRVNDVFMGGGGGGGLYFGQIPAISGAGNTSVGLNVFAALSSGGDYNTGVGESVLQANTSGSINTAVGYNSMKANTVGYSNVAVGVNSMLVNTTGFQNTGVGAGVFENMTKGQENVGVGYDAAHDLDSGYYNVAIGWHPHVGSYGGGNIAIGYKAFYDAGTGWNPSNNIIIGNQAGADASQRENAVHSIGIGAFVNTDCDSCVVLGNPTINLKTQLTGNRLINTGVSRGVANYVLTDSLGTGQYWVGRPLSAIGIPISSLTAATGTNSIDNGGFEQVWSWSSGFSTFGLTLNSNTTTASNNSSLLYVQTQGANGTAGRTTYSQIIDNFHTGTSSTNVGLRVSAASGTNNYAIIVPASSGSVGIGTSTPSAIFHSVGTARFDLGSDATGDIFYRDASGFLTRLPIGTAAQTLHVVGGLPAWRDTATGGGGGVTTMAAIGSSPNANGATISGVNLNLEPASASFGGVVTTAAQTFAGLKTFGAITQTGQYINSLTGAASTPSISITGNPYTAGTATTNHPLHYMNGGTAPTTWSTAGTYGGINAVSGFTGNFLDYHVNGGTSVAKVDYEGTGTFKGVTIGKYGGATGVSQASGDMYFYTGSGALIYTAGSAGQRIEIAGAGAYTQNSLIYGGNTAYTRMGSNLSIFGSAGETRLGAGGTENYLTIQTDGDVGIGQTSPAARLDILKTTEQLRISYDGSNYVSNTVSSAGVLTIAPTGASVTVTKPVVLKNYTVATLPAGVQGMVAFVTDALAPAYLVTVVGGGAVVTPVFYDGTNWIAH